MTDITATGWYANAFKAWSTKQLGSKPTADQLANIHDLGARPGKQALACAMSLRPEGVTGPQIVIACGAPQLNKMRGFATDGLLRRLPAAPSAANHTVYHYEVTPKGMKRIETTRKRAAAASEAAGLAEAREIKRAPGNKQAKADKSADDLKAAGKARRAALTGKARGVAGGSNKPTSEAPKPAEGHTTPVPANDLPAEHVTQLPANNL